MNVLVVQMGFLGDVLLSSPLLRNIKRVFPHARLSTLTTPQARKLYQYHPDVAEALAFDKRGVHSGVWGAVQMARELRRKKFDLVVSLHRSFRTAAVLALAGIPERYGFSEAAGAWLYTKTTPRLKGEHDVLRNLSILTLFEKELPEIDLRLALELPSEVRDGAEQLLSRESSRVIAVAPGSVWATKRWLPGGFAAVARAFSERGDRVVLIGGNDDIAIGREIEAAIGGGVLNLIGKTDLLLSAAVIEQSDLLITNDSAPLHIASAVGTPTVALFCATVPEFGFGPWGVSSEIVEVKDLPCRPCGRHGGSHCPVGTNACQTQLRPADVIAAAERVLLRTSPDTFAREGNGVYEGSGVGQESFLRREKSSLS